MATLLTPILVVALTIAWLAARDGDADDARSAEGLPGELKAGNIVVVTGRWVYDAGHEGWNELHPVTSIKKIGESFNDTRLPPIGNGEEFVRRQCVLMAPVPPPDRDGPGAKPKAMTPAQEETWENQRQPEHRWNLHPSVDGCAPTDRDGPDDVIK